MPDRREDTAVLDRLTSVSRQYRCVRSFGRTGSALRLLIVFGSRARGTAQEHSSDWDLAFLADDALDPDVLLADLVTALRSERVDLVDLARAGGQLRFRVARDGQVVHARTVGEFHRFWLDAVSMFSVCTQSSARSWQATRWQRS
jgi:predicted nucleotidyltransferase